MTKRITPQTSGSTSSACARIDTEAREASAAKVRTCPTVRTARGAQTEPSRKPTKKPDMISPIRLLPKPSWVARTPSRLPCRPLPSISRPIPTSSAQLPWIAGDAGRRGAPAGGGGVDMRHP